VILGWSRNAPAPSVGLASLRQLATRHSIQKMKRAVIAISIGALVWLAGFGTAAVAGAAPLQIQALISPSGHGRLVVNNGEAPWVWEECAPDRSSCHPFGRGREIETKAASVGTVFRVRSHGATGVSPEWLGRLTATKRPRVDGIVRANEFVSPVPGQWKGGWEGEYSEMQLAACITAEAEDCITLTDPFYLRSCASDASFALEERFVGRYLRVANRRVGAGPPARPFVAVTSPYGDEVWRRSRNTSIAMLGQIAATTQTYPGECGPPPSGSALIDERGRALVDCQGGCRAILVARRNGRQLQVSRTLPSRSALLVPPPTELGLSSHKIKARLGAGRINFAVSVNGKRAAQRSVLIG
jgi:hypothetical protein